MKTKKIIITIVCGLLSVTGTFAQNGGTGGSSSPGKAPDAAINKPRSVEPSLNHPNVAHPTNSDSGFSHGVITNRIGSGTMTNGGMVFTNGFGSGSLTNRVGNHNLTNNDNGFSLVGTNNGRLINPTNPYANYTNRYSTNGNPYATDPRVMERGRAITNR